MLIRVEKKLRVVYSALVRDCVRHLRVLPPQTAREDWHCWPEPDAAREFFDDFGNRVLELRHAKIEREFLFELNLQVEKARSGSGATLRSALFQTGASEDQRLEEGGAQRSPASHVMGEQAQWGLPETGLGAFLLPSALCDLDNAIRRAAAPFQSLPKSELPAALCDWSHRALRYESEISGVETTASRSLARGAGVCQDYAHLMIALCRALSLPARYVAGYAPGEGRMHAWVEVLIDNQWQAWDPTHNRAARSECVAVAIGRDFRDANPHQGIFRGRAKATLDSGCRVRAEN